MATVHGVESHAHGFNQCDLLWLQAFSRNHFLPRNGNELAHGTMTLNAQRLVVLAGIEAAATTTGTATTGSIGVHRHLLTDLQPSGNVGTDGFDDGTDFMTGDDRLQCQSVAATIGVEV